MYYKKNMAEFTEYYLTIEDNRAKTKVIFEKENMHVEPPEIQEG